MSSESFFVWLLMTSNLHSSSSFLRPKAHGSNPSPVIVHTSGSAIQYGVPEFSSFSPPYLSCVSQQCSINTWSVSKSHLRLCLAGSADWCKPSVSKVRFALVDPSNVSIQVLESSMHTTPSSGSVRFCPRPRACECWTALLDPNGSLELVAPPECPMIGAVANCFSDEGLWSTARSISSAKYIVFLSSWRTGSWATCPLQQPTTLCGMHECCGMLTTTKCSTLGANAVWQNRWSLALLTNIDKKRMSMVHPSLVGGSFSARVPRSSAEVRRVFIHDIMEVEGVGQQE